MSDLRPVIYLTVGEVERFHAEIMQRAGQLPTPPRDRGLLESAVQRPQTAAYYDGADIIMQAAFYMTGIAANHPFVDGNKRTGFISGMVFLRINGVTQGDPRLDDPEMGVWLEEVIAHLISFEQVVQRLRERIASIEEP